MTLCIPLIALGAAAQSYTFTTLAGTNGGFGSGDGAGSAARFHYPTGVATDSAGNVYVADEFNNTIRKISPAGVVTTLAGLSGVAGSNDGIRSTAGFYYPAAMTTDSAGSVYVADQVNHTIRKITLAGVVTTLAGSAGLAGSSDGAGSSARFNYPTGVASDSSGNLYVADQYNHTIRKITPAGVVTTLAGSAGVSGSVDGTGSAARFYYPASVATDSAGSVYVADQWNHTIRKITVAGEVTTFAGSAGFGGSTDGTGSAARFNHPRGIATDNAGDVYVADSSNNTIRKITPAGVVTTLAGSAGVVGSVDGTGGAARFNTPTGVSTDSVGNVYVADSSNNTIRKITPAGVVTTLAGSADVSGSVDGTASDARFNYPARVATDSAGNIYVADAGNNTIRKITPAGVVTTLAGSAGVFGSADGTGSEARFHYPYGVATDSAGNLYVADQGNSTIRKITLAGVVSTFAGSAGVLGWTDGTGSAASFFGPIDVATDSAGNVYVADRDNSTIRKITPAGVVTTLAGSALLPDSVDGTGTAARFSYPIGVATDSSDNVYVADTGNHTIRKITPAGVVTTLAGSPGVYGIADGTGSGARFNGPTGVATWAGNVYVADQGSSTIRKITPAGVVTTLAGLAGVTGSDDGTGSGARFNRPESVATDSAGNLYAADSNNDRIRIGRPALDDAATIDLSTGSVGAVRQLSTSPDTATIWQWSLIRQPAGSSATISATTVRNPLFTPDVADLYIFRLTASSAAGSRISTVTLAATPADTTTSLTSSPNPSTSGQPVTLTATVSAAGGTPTGTVTFSEGLTTLGVGTLVSGQTTISTSSLIIGTHSVIASYGGDPNFLPSTSSTLSQTVNPPFGPPPSFSASATGTSDVALAWAQVGDATSYEVWRSSFNSAYALLLTTTGSSALDTGLSPNTTYLYKIRAIGSSGPSSFTAVDPATTILFSDTALNGVSIRALHITELRTAVNAMRAAAGLPAALFTDDPLAAGTTIKAVHLTELRARLDEARSAIALPAIVYTDTTVTPGSTAVKAAHILELRGGTQ